MNKRTTNWLVPEGFDSHWVASLDPILSPHGYSDAVGSGIESVRFLHSILSHISESEEGMGVTELAIALDTSKARISRHMKALEELGFVDRCGSTRKFIVGSTITAWGLRGLRFRGIDDLIQTALHELRAHTGGKVVIFSILEKRWGRVCYSLRATSGDPLIVPIGAPLIFPRSPSARILWAFSPNSESLLRSARANGFIDHTPFETVADLNDCLADTRSAGVSATYDVSMNNRGSVAAPVFGKDSELLGALAIVDYSSNMRNNDIEKLTAQLKITARNLTSKLGEACS